ncbi:hypothetical protein [Paenibacillus apiarius]|uniref:hypothetical protein n=1 Tax=Paenibacillus apiarius TaxID=46240 RepID=UPI0019815926|nr:hypothetical protein [Paenibacillus apiarius]MBN3522634.1 hypothetical protein [Paenibacillus apiarius]
MFEKIKELIKNNSMDDIYLTGVVHIEENGVAEFVANTNFLYFEFGDQFIELEAIDGYGRLHITIVDFFKHENNIEDVTPSRAKIGDVIFTNPIATNEVNSMVFFNLEIRENALICDVLHIRLINGQDLFIDPQFMGINIGGIEQKHFWEENFVERVLPRVGGYPKETYIKFDNK